MPTTPTFTVGDKVVVFKYGTDYVGTVVKVGRTRVHVEYRLRKGTLKTLPFAMTEVRPWSPFKGASLKAF